MGGIEIRRVLPTEQRAVARLTVGVYVEEGYIDPADAYVEELTDTGRRATEAEVWVAVEQGGQDYGRIKHGRIKHGRIKHGRIKHGRIEHGRIEHGRIEHGEEDGPVLGSVTFCPVGSSYREISKEGEGEFRMLAVSPAARGRGIGRLLVEHCVWRARDLGYPSLRISTMEQMTTAHHLYERIGFSRSPADDWSPVPGVALLAYRITLPS